jgi:hypothetical protein
MVLLFKLVFYLVQKTLLIPRAKTYGRNWLDPLYFRRIPLEHTGNTPEDGSSIPTGTFSDFFLMISDRFLPESTGNWQEFTGKNPKNFRPEYCFHFRGISGAFPRDTVTFPHLSCRIPQDMVAGIFVLGMEKVFSF